MFLKSQLGFVLKVIFISALLSFFIKYGLDGWLFSDYQIYLALTIILFPVLSLSVIFSLRRR